MRANSSTISQSEKDLVMIENEALHKRIVALSLELKAKDDNIDKLTTVIHAIQAKNAENTEKLSELSNAEIKRGKSVQDFFETLHTEDEKKIDILQAQCAKYMSDSSAFRLELDRVLARYAPLHVELKNMKEAYAKSRETNKQLEDKLQKLSEQISDYCQGKSVNVEEEKQRAREERTQNKNHTENKEAFDMGEDPAKKDEQDPQKHQEESGE
ncbi:hypothetical protein GUITHDRAFT_134311 [Guillardia theta CCMP2712]|uniref:Uncharacterized protein n=1 Tax=Guillardia theta (strain CCMP2712) TaxID=905079 RepID=L1JV87_GUITC|nr:hypothetical protein GUITHDRAFT_134311 [Guillardia theta CCMP2712]EKX52008.1 hypothetical protein GUITHDRAFT_134311 [Guillardia theta CCMP2712]|eukprot:XP_005838988.1 hypothetical protein GUITHDRAFT_134311 [Guillardia theta CCMP2712]